MGIRWKRFEKMCRMIKGGGVTYHDMCNTDEERWVVSVVPALGEHGILVSAATSDDACDRVLAAYPDTRQMSVQRLGG